MSQENEQVGEFIRASIASSGGTILTPPEVVRSLFRGDAPTEVADLVAALMLPQPGGYVLDALDVPPVTFLVGLETGLLVARPGMTYFPCRTHDPGGVVTGFWWRG